jgi:hypothetical protein
LCERRDTTLPTSKTDLPVNLGADQRADYANLPTETLRREALRYLTRLKKHPRLGLELRDHPTLGDLSDCRKVYFDENPNVPPRWRIVYRLVPNALSPTSVEIVSIGKRAYGEAYRVAVTRLGR